jgi:hypothetical protein
MVALSTRSVQQELRLQGMVPARRVQQPEPAVAAAVATTAAWPCWKPRIVTAAAAVNRAARVECAGGVGSAIGYAIAAVAALWLPVQSLFHAGTAAHVRRTSVTFAVALQCSAALAHGASDLHVSFLDRATHRLSEGAEGRAARAGAGHAFRLVPASAWLGDDAPPPPSAALFEVLPAAVRLARPRRGGHLPRRAARRGPPAAKARSIVRGCCVTSLEARAAGDVTPGNQQQQQQQAAHAQPHTLGVRHAGAALLALLDVEPHARLDAKLSRKLAPVAASASSEGTTKRCRTHATGRPQRRSGWRSGWRSCCACASS